MHGDMYACVCICMSVYAYICIYTHIYVVFCAYIGTCLIRERNLVNRAFMYSTVLDISCYMGTFIYLFVCLSNTENTMGKI